MKKNTKQSNVNAKDEDRMGSSPKRLEQHKSPYSLTAEERSPKRAKKEKNESRNRNQAVSNQSITNKSPQNKPNGNSNGPTEGLNFVSNGATSNIDISTVFSEHDRLLPGLKQAAMAANYGSSTP